MKISREDKNFSSLLFDLKMKLNRFVKATKLNWNPSAAVIVDHDLSHCVLFQREWILPRRGHKTSPLNLFF